jgi:hypothetical protein
MGEQTGDMATTYGAMERFSLPESGIVVTYPKALIIRQNGVEKVTPEFNRRHAGGRAQTRHV